MLRRHLGGLILAATWFLIITTVSAQQFDGFSYPYNTLGLSQACLNAVNTTLTSCPHVLGTYTTADSSVDLLDEETLNAICTTACSDQLQSLRQSITAACTAVQDVMVYNKIAYPATFMVDKLEYTYNVGCYRDASSGTFCDLILAEWRNETNITTAEQAANDCSDCMLGPYAVQLDSPLGYSSDFAAQFASLTSSCGATGYAYTVPTAYALNSTTSATATATASSTASSTPTSCVASYTVGVNETCNDIAESQGVSTYDLMNANDINIFCSNLVEGSTLCIPDKCTTVTVLPEDSCASWMATYNISMAQLQAWNPIFDSNCMRIVPWVNWQICVGPPGGYTDAVVGAPTSAAPLPTNGMSDSNQNCGKWATVNDGDTCSSLSVAYGISLSDFYFLNPEVDATCTNLWLGSAYCVSAVGDIATYSGYPTTVASTSFTRPATTTTSYTVAPSTALAAAPGTVTGCAVSRDYYNASSLDVFGQTYAFDTFDINNCTTVAATYGVTVAQLILWNPSLDADNCALQAGYSYCVILDFTAQDEGVAGGSTRCEAANSSQIVTGTASDCSCYTLLLGSERDDVTCASIEDDFALTEANLLLYNPWLASTGCDAALYDGLADDDLRALCVAVGGDTSSSTTTTVPTTTPATTTTTTSSSETSPTITPMPDIVDNCTKYHVVVDGDGCYDIAIAYDISLSDFYAWNPDVGTDCASLWLGYGVCVGVS